MKPKERQVARRKRGFFAEIQHQAAVAEKKRERQDDERAKAKLAADRAKERALDAARRAAAAAERADSKARVAAEREAKKYHVEAMELMAKNATTEVEQILAEIAGVLEATLEHDDFVDLEALRQVADHPQFISPSENPLAVLAPIEAGPEPVFREPEAPTGIKAIFGGKSKHAQAVAEARQQHEAAHEAWRTAAAEVPMKQLAQMQNYQEAEQARLAQLASDRRQYDAECDRRVEEVATHNRELDEFIADLGQGRKESVEEYFAIVLGNSVYPEDLDVGSDLVYDPAHQELEVKLILPLPEDLPGIKGFRYVKSQDEIVEVARTATDLKRGYADFCHQVALRTLHEIWEADRSDLIATISMIAGTDNISPATGQEVFTPLIAVAADRETFEGINLANVKPAESLKHLKAVVSKDPLNFVAIDLSKGVRG